MSPVAPAPHRHAGSATVSTGAGRAVDKLRTFVGCRAPPYHGITDSSSSTHMVFGSRGQGDHSLAVTCIWKRCFCSSHDSTKHHHLPPTSEESLDFMMPPQQHRIGTSSFEVLSGGKEGTQSFKEAVDEDKITSQNHLEVGNLRKLFQKYERPLKVRGLLSPFSLNNKKCQGLHAAYHRIVGKVVYLTSYDFVKSVECMPRCSRRLFLDFLCDERIIVTPDWEVTHTLYDHGLRCPPDSRKLHKGESDASFDHVGKKANQEKKARIGVIIWRDDQVMWSEVLENVDCDSSVQAEALAMCLLLKRAIQRGISSLEVCTDCDVVDRVIRGDERPGDKKTLGELYSLLRCLVSHLDELVCRWVPRQSITFVDGLLRNNDLFGRVVSDVIGRTHTDNKVAVNKLAISILRKWEPHLNGDPIFSINDRPSSLKNIARQNPQNPDEWLQPHTMCYHLAGENDQDKLNAIYHICRALGPSEVQFWMNDFESTVAKVMEIHDTFGLGKGQELVKEEKLCMLSLVLGNELVGEAEKQMASKCLTVIWDPEVLQEKHFDENSFTIVLASQEEKSAVETLEEFSPVTFASFKSLHGNRRLRVEEEP